MMHRNDPILIIEDSDEDFFAAQRVLAKFGNFPLLRCCRGGEVISVLNESGRRPPSLIFLDLNLQGKRDGRSVLTDLKADARFRKIPVVIMTTSSNPSDVRHCFDCGAAGYLVKPVSLDKFVESIQCVLKYWFEIMTLPAKVGVAL